MRELRKQHYTGERALFMVHDAKIVDCLFDDGESPLKECLDLEVKTSTFDWKYPLWYGNRIQVSDCKFTVNARAGIWYTNDASFSSCLIEAPKCFRACHNLTLENLNIPEAKETVWSCDGVTIKDVTVSQADYFGYHSKNIVVDNLTLQGNYIFDSCENITISNSKLMTKDAFWNCKHVKATNCYIEGEYIGWNSEDLEFVDCVIRSHQGLCYIKKLKMVNCQLLDTDLCFEYCSEIDAEINSEVMSIKNPLSGVIKVKKVGEIILDDPNVDHSQTKIVVGE